MRLEAIVIRLKFLHLQPGSRPMSILTELGYTAAVDFGRVARRMAER